MTKRNDRATDIEKSVFKNPRVINQIKTCYRLVEAVNVEGAFDVAAAAKKLSSKDVAEALDNVNVKTAIGHGWTGGAVLISRLQQVAGYMLRNMIKEDQP